MNDHTHKKTAEEYLNCLSLSDRMEDELRQCLRYAAVCNEDADDLLCRACSGYGAQEHLNKVQSKKVLADLRELCIKGTGTLENASDAGLKEENTGKRSQEKTHIKVSENGKRTIYIEEKLADRADIILKINKLFPDAEIVTIHHYKDIFNEKGHDFASDKERGDIIIAANHDTLFYPGAPFCQSFGNENFYYTSLVKNCIYNCSYCYLSGMYPRGLMVVFVNIEDYFARLTEILKEKPVYLCVSYDTDLLALEPVLHYAEKWVEYAKKHDNLRIEIRTKSGNAEIFGKLKERAGVCSNVIFAWTLSPVEISEKFEKNMPGLKERITALKACHSQGFPVRLCFDPMIYHKNWEENYSRLFETVFSQINPRDIEDISVGVFRISNNFLRRMRNVWGDTEITAFPYITENGACHYGCISREMVRKAVEEISVYFPKEKIYCWDGSI